MPETKDVKEVKKVTTNTIQKMKQAGEKISMITAYDFSFARIFDDAGIGRGCDHPLDGLGMDDRCSGKLGRVDVTVP